MNQPVRLTNSPESADGPTTKNQNKQLTSKEEIAEAFQEINELQKSNCVMALIDYTW